MNFAEAISTIRSIRKYQDRDVEEEKLQRILETARLAPSALNRQPYRIYVVKQKDRIQLISSACKQEWKVPIMIAIVSEPREAWIRDDGEEFWKADAAIVLHQFSLAAWAEGLGTCSIAAFKEEEIKQILELGSEFRVCFLTPLGYPAEKKVKPTSRKTLDELVRII